MEGLQYGDAHTHSDKTSDQVEFGVPVNAAILLAQSMGLTYFCVADHSYDLDDSPADYTVNHPDIPKWGDLTREVKLANARNRKFAVIQGEEISCRNDEGRNVHFLLFGNKEFFSGSGDSAEQWFKTHSEHSIADILARKDSGAVAFAAHPSEPVPFLQRLLLARGAWTTADFSQHGLAGIQFANGAAGEGFSEGYSAWVAMLLRGHRLFCLAGNDAHGNFNRYRQIGIPFVSIREHGEQLFGRMRTAVYLEGRPGQRAVLESLAAGSFVITDGPCINVTDSTDKESPTVIGRTLRRGKRNLVFSAVSSGEFGALQNLVVYGGIVGEKEESVVAHEQISGKFRHTITISTSGLPYSYLRVEARTSPFNASDRRSHFCITNPIWLTGTSVRH